MRICCVISTLGLGGAQRVLVSLCAAWVARGDQVTIVTLSRAQDDYFAIDLRIRRIELGLFAESHGLLDTVVSTGRRLRAIRRAVREVAPDVVLSFLDTTNVLTLMATWGLSVPVVVAERTYPGAHALGRVRGTLRWLAYGWAQLVVAQTGDTAEWLARHTRAVRISVIPNSLAPAFRSVPATTARAKRVLAAGRLSRQKGFDLLLRAWAAVGAPRDGWTLRVVGEGPERTALLDQARQLGIAGSVELPGASPDMATEYASSAAFVLSSRFEGFPNALVEALASGCDCVAFDCRTGPREIFDRVGAGTLVAPGDVAGMARALEATLASPATEPERIALAARTRDRFRFEAGFTAWDDALRSACASRTA